MKKLGKLYNQFNWDYTNLLPEHKKSALYMLASNLKTIDDARKDHFFQRQYHSAKNPNWEHDWFVKWFGYEEKTNIYFKD